MKSFETIIPTTHSGWTISAFCLEQFKDAMINKSQGRKMFADKLVELDGIPVKEWQIVQAGQMVRVYERIQTAKMQCTVHYEDVHVLVVSKEAGVGQRGMLNNDYAAWKPVYHLERALVGIVSPYHLSEYE
jgi:23S rRNA-/tRNA-specific pseudouridylate synthase